MPPPSMVAELPVIVLLMSFALPRFIMPPPLPAELPETVLLMIVIVPAELPMPPPPPPGVAGDGAVDNYQRAVVFNTTAEAVVGSGVAGDGAVGDR